MKIILWCLTLALFMPPSLVVASGGGNCLMCHGNDKVMKMMVKPPEISGEGEG